MEQKKVFVLLLFMALQEICKYTKLSMTQLKACALKHLQDQGKVIGISHEDTKCQKLDVLGQQIGFGLSVLPCAPTDHLYPDFRRRHKAYSKMWTESPPEGTLERRTETYLISS